MKLRLMCTLVALVMALFGGRSSIATADLVNGDFEATPADIYFDGFAPDLADDVPGWELFLGAADGSYVYVNGVGGGNVDLDMGIGPSGGGIRTAAGSRVPVFPGGSYEASLTYDNYFGATGTEFFIDWFDGVGTLLTSTGGPLADPNGPFGYEPYTQRLSVAGMAPAGAVSAGVRLTSGNTGYNGLAADNFSFVPEPSAALLLAMASTALWAVTNRRRN